MLVKDNKINQLHNYSRKIDIPIRYFDLTSRQSPLSFAYEIKQDYGVFEKGDKAIFVPLEVNKDSPHDGAIILVRDRVGIFSTYHRNFDAYDTCQLHRLDNNELIFSWKSRFNVKYKIQGLFTGILKLRNLENENV